MEKIIANKSDTGLWVITVSNGNGIQATAPASRDKDNAIQTALHLFRTGYFDRPYMPAGNVKKNKSQLHEEKYPDVVAFPVENRQPMNTTQWFEGFGQFTFIAALIALVAGSFVFGAVFYIPVGFVIFFVVLVLAMRQRT